ncbi:MAG: AAA family ATPase [Phycisphaeraceae bacterium]
MSIPLQLRDEQPLPTIADRDLELLLLGALIAADTAHTENAERIETVFGRVDPGDFLGPHARAFYEAMRTVWIDARGLPLQTIASHVTAPASRWIDGQLVDAVEQAPEHLLEHYADQVTDLATRRRLADAGQYIKTIATQAETPEKAAEQARQALDQVAIRSSGAAVVRCMADIKPEPIRWLWPGRIALGKLAILAGNGGLGKSTVALDIAARVSTGRGFPDQSEVDGGSPANVILLSAEDDPADTIRPRLDAAGADPRRIYIIEAIRRRDSGEGTERAFSLATDIAELERVVDQIGGVRLIIIDPITAYCGASDDHRNAEVRGLLAPLSALAAPRGAAVVAVTHLRKGGGQAIHQVIGSVAWAAAARTGMAFSADPEDPRRRIMTTIKSNIAPEADGLAYRIETPVEQNIGAVVWEEGPIDLSAEDALNGGGQGDRSELIEAKAWLKTQLADGPIPAKAIKNQAQDDGFSERTLKRAKRDLGIVSGKTGFGEAGKWTWSLPEGGQEDAKEAMHQGVTPFEDSGPLWRPNLEDAGEDSEVRI